jgi:Tol biopolymer transport system component
MQEVPMKRLALGCAVVTLFACSDQPVGPVDPAQDLAPEFAKGQPAKGRIVFWAEAGLGGEHNLYSVNVDGSGLTLLTPGPLGGRRPAWQPKGKLIAFDDDRFGADDIFVMNEDGTGVTRLTTSPANERNPAWSPDGRRIAYQSDEVGPFADIYVMNADGTGKTRITFGGIGDRQPAWAPADRIAFVTDRAGQPEIWAMDPDGSNPTPIVEGPALARRDPAWSPRGARIAWFDSAIPGIQVADGDGSNATNLTPLPGSLQTPRWSPDGRQIAFSVNLLLPGVGRDLYRVNADGTAVTQITFLGADGVTLTWSPDWKR